MAVDTASPGDEVTSELWNQISGLLNGTTGKGQPVKLYDFNDASAYSLIVGNQDTTNGYIQQWQTGPVVSPTVVGTVTKNGIQMTAVGSLFSKLSVGDAVVGATSDFLVSKVINSGAGRVLSDTVVELTGAAGDVGAMRAIAKQTAAGTGTQLRAGEFHTMRLAAAVSGLSAWGQEIGLHSEVSTSGNNIGIYLTCYDWPVSGFGTTIQGDHGILIGGTRGFNKPISFYHTDGSTVRWQVDSAGGQLSGALLPRTTDTFDVGAAASRWLRVWSNAFVAENDSAAGPSYTFRNDTTSGAYLVNAGTYALSSGGEEALRLDANHNIVMGRVATANTFAAFATTATGGFPYVPTMAGSPIGVLATSYTGRAAGPIIDSANLRVYFNVAGTWRYAALT